MNTGDNKYDNDEAPIKKKAKANNGLVVDFNKNENNLSNNENKKASVSKKQANEDIQNEEASEKNSSVNAESSSDDGRSKKKSKKIAKKEKKEKTSKGGNVRVTKDEVIIDVILSQYSLINNFVYEQLNERKRVSVRKFKGKVLIDIREFWEKDGEQLPTKKGEFNIFIQLT